jgi:hypothetical protein
MQDPNSDLTRAEDRHSVRCMQGFSSEGQRLAFRRTLIGTVIIFPEVFLVIILIPSNSSEVGDNSSNSVERESHMIRLPEIIVENLLYQTLH